MRHLLATVLCAAASCALANASIIVSLGNNPQADEHNVLLNNGTTGMTVNGTFNDLAGVIVDFTSLQTLSEPSSGQARVEASSGPLTDITVSLENGLIFGDIIFNPSITTACDTCGGTANLTVNSLDSLNNPEAPTVFAYALGNGNNFATVVASGGESITSVSLSIAADVNGNAGVNDLRQVRMSGIGNLQLPQPVPEPGIYLLLGSGLGVLGLIRRRRPQTGA